MLHLAPDPLPAKHGISAKMRVHRVARDARSFAGAADVRAEPERVEQWPAPREYLRGSFMPSHANGRNWSPPHFGHGGAASSGTRLVNFLTWPHFTHAHAIERTRSISRMRPKAYSAFSLIVVRISRSGLRAFSSSMEQEKSSLCWRSCRPQRSNASDQLG